MKCIIVIKGVTRLDYERIRLDLVEQITRRGFGIPLFCRLPADYSDIEVVWLDEEMEKSMFSEALKGVQENESRPTL